MDDKGQHPLLAGAKVTLSGVNIVGKDFSDYKPEEIAFIVMRYMVQNADGNLYVGSVTRVMKKLWPDEENFSPKFMKRIYRFLKIYGFRHYVDNFGEDCWRVSIDAIDKGYQDKTPIRKVDTPVIYRCANCDAGPWNDRAEFVKHRETTHKETKLTTITNEDGVAKYICDICGREFENGHAYGGHMNHHYYDENLPRPEKQPTTRKMTSKQKSLLDAIKQYEGLTPKEYAELLGVSRNTILNLAAGLRDRKKIKSTGRRHTTRYHLDKRRIQKPKIETSKEIIAAIEKPEPVIEPQAVAEIPDTIVQVLGAENIFQTSDGKTWMLKDGDLYIVTLEKVAGK